MSTKPDTETGWNKGLPAKSGWYFMRNEGEGVFAEGMIVWVGHNQSGVRHEGEFMYASHPWLKRREFLGPILHSDFEQLIRLQDWKESAMNLLSRYDQIAEIFGGKLGSSKIDNLKRGVERLRKAAESVLRYLDQESGRDYPFNKEPQNLAHALREALAHTGEQS